MDNKVKAILITFGVIFLGSLLTVEESFAGNRLSKCGGSGQRPCRIWEKIPSCDSGLKEDFIQDKCVGTTSGGGGGGGGSGFPSTCGAENQRPCLIIEHIPSCQSGLVENFIDNKCLASGEGSQIGEIVADFEPPDCDTVFGTNTEPTINSLYNFKLATGIPALLAEKIVPTDTIATPVRVVAALAFLTHFYCELTLEREVAQAGADFEADMFSEVLQTLVDNEANFNTKSGQIQSSQAANAASNASGQATIMNAQTANAASNASGQKSIMNAQATNAANNASGQKSIMNAQTANAASNASGQAAIMNAQTANAANNASGQAAIMNAQATNATNNEIGQAAIMTAQDLHDADMKAELMTLKDSLEAKLAELKTLLQTPQGSREGFSNKK